MRVLVSARWVIPSDEKCLLYSLNEHNKNPVHLLPSDSSNMTILPKSRRVQLLSVPDCPLVGRARNTLANALALTRTNVGIEELVGDYGSPTVLVDGFDVTGRSSGCHASCRLDLPTEEQVVAALRGLSIVGGESVLARQLQEAAFHILLHTRKPVTLDHLAARTGDIVGMADGVEELRKSGHIQLDSDGNIIGALGLTLRSTIHRLSIHDSTLWAWCAFDVLGIFGALRTSGEAVSADPCNGEEIRLKFADGIPQNTEPTIFMADVQNDRSLCENWCSKVNFFASARSAEVWVEASGLSGSLVSVRDLAPVAAEVWSRLLSRDRTEVHS
jgi:hypothetical protein